MRRHLPILAAVLALAPPGRSGAAELRADERPTLAAGEVIEDDLYLAGGEVRVRGTVRGDLVVAAGEFTLEGRVTGDLIVASGSATVRGPVDGSLRIAAGEVTVAAPIGEDAILAAGRVEVQESARIGRDLVVGSGEALVAGSVGRHVRAGAGQVRLLADVGGDARLASADVEVADVSIGGDLAVPENARLEQDPGARIGGRTIRTERLEYRPTVLTRIWRAVRMLVGLWALGALFALAAPRWASRTPEELRRRPLASGLVGLAVLVGAPIAAAIVLGVGALVGGWWIGLFLLALLVIAAFVGLALAGRAIGELVGARAGKAWPWPLALLVGVAALALVGAVPILGGLVLFVALLLGTGALVLAWLGRAWGRQAPAAYGPTGAGSGPSTS